MQHAANESSDPVTYSLYQCLKLELDVVYRLFSSSALVSDV